MKNKTEGNNGVLVRESDGVVRTGRPPQSLSAKDIILKSIDSSSANKFVRRNHYSGKVVPNSTLHFGAFLNGKLHGVLSFGPSMRKKATINLIPGTKWNGFIELNRMAFDDYLPKNSESRCIAIAIKLIKKYAPHIQWVISFADGTQCGDGTIYRASGFKLVEIRKNDSIRIDPATGERMHFMQSFHLKRRSEFKNWTPLEGNQLKYIYLIDKTLKLSVPELPFNAIDELGAGMYKGEKITLAERRTRDSSITANATGFQSVEGGQHDPIAQQSNEAE